MVIVLVVFGGLLKCSFVIVLLPSDAIASDLLSVPGLPFGAMFNLFLAWSVVNKSRNCPLLQLIVPINQGRIHWALALVDIKKQTLEYFDSSVVAGEPVYTFSDPSEVLSDLVSRTFVEEARFVSSFHACVSWNLKATFCHVLVCQPVHSLFCEEVLAFETY